MQTTASPPAAPSVARGVIRLVASTIVFGALLFLLAGTVAWPAAWVYLAIVVTVLSIYSVILITRHPDLVAERTRPPSDAKKWDRPFVAIVGGAGPIALLVVAGLDHRFAWSRPMPVGVIVAGLLLVAAGGSLTNYAVAVNRFFSAIVRVQRERGHRVIEAGPYQFLRHPGYVGSILHMIGTCLALGSWWALALAAALSLVLAIRTGLEDRTLQAELEGYADYAQRVKYRLVPWVW